MKNTYYSNLLLRVAAIFGLIGAVLGSHMAGSMDYSWRPVHAHILVVGWLSLFAWAVFYRVFKPVPNWMSALHVYCAIIGVTLLTLGMAMNIFVDIPRALYLFVYIGGGVTVLVSFGAFVLQTWRKQE
ncbi:hypothetical protein [Paenisporosarcina cavernae]|uniref:Cytochrome-c oxidase n=1 Tax=Paenisporosarcina cavernae TaxID=2320858 RepID=A0A385YQP5_9BACL|nr:hypothetical protein [Paenisporosarcina cavernae]AYC28906.1 hypothetical protein D3873_03110 [Paenisporosarcina cavernae]